MTEPKPKLTGYNAAYRKKLEEEFFDSAHGSRTNKIPMWMREPISRLLREIENSRAALAVQATPPEERRNEAVDELPLNGIPITPEAKKRIGRAIADELKMNWQNDDDVIDSFGRVAALAYALAVSPQRRVEPSPTCSGAVCLSPRACDYHGKCKHDEPQHSSPTDG